MSVTWSRWTCARFEQQHHASSLSNGRVLKLSELFFLLRRGKPWNGVARSSPLGSHTHLWLVFGSGLAQNHNRIQGLRIEAGHQIDIAGTVLLPQLADLNLPHAHWADIDSRGHDGGCQLPDAAVCIPAQRPGSTEGSALKEGPRTLLTPASIFRRSCRLGRKPSCLSQHPMVWERFGHCPKAGRQTGVYWLRAGGFS